MPALTWDHRRGHDAAIGVDEVHDENLEMAGFGRIAKLESVEFRLKELVSVSSGCMSAKNRWLAFGKLMARPSRIMTLPCSCTAGLRSSTP